MTRGALIAYLEGSEMQDSDEVVFKTADGTNHAAVDIFRTGSVQTTLPPTAPYQEPVITIQLA